MKIKKIITILSVLSSSLIFSLQNSNSFAQEESAPPFPRMQNVITQVSGDLYRAGNGAWFTIFLVTDEGIILGDPLNAGFAAWLKPELEQRFNVPVRYVVYSHSHFDHAPGGEVFADTATFVGHENMAKNMDGRYPQMPGDMVDRNNNGLVDYEEIMIPTEAQPGICGWSPAFFDMFEHEVENTLTPAELQAGIVPPTILYSDRMTIKLGGKTVELIFPGLNHSNDATVMHFPEERTVFISDFLVDALVRDNINSLPSSCGPFDGSPLSEWIKSYRTVEAIDFDILAPGHGGNVYDKSGVTGMRQYFEDLRDAVSNAMSQGLSLEEMKQTIMLEQYSDWVNYDLLRESNIDSAYQNLLLYRD